VSEQAAPPRVSDEIERWLAAEGETTVGGFIEFFGEKTFALLFVILLGVPALPLPTGGVTHVLEVVAVLIALQLIAGREEIWLPERWRKVELAGPRQQRFLQGLLRMIRRLERFSHARQRWLFERRATDIVYGLLVLALSVAAFFAPPFTGLDTLPALAAVVLSLGVLLEDIVVVAAGLVVGVVGVALEILLASAAVKGIGSLF
jgi:hypothetical protein